MVVGAAHSIGFGMGNLPLNPVCPVAQLVEARTAGGARGVRTVLAAPSKRVQHLTKGCHGHRLFSIVATGEHVCMAASNALQRA